MLQGRCYCTTYNLEKRRKIAIVIIYIKYPCRTKQSSIIFTIFLQIVEQGKPSDLLKVKEGIFTSMLEASRAPESGSWSSYEWWLENAQKGFIIMINVAVTKLSLILSIWI